MNKSKTENEASFQEEEDDEDNDEMTKSSASSDIHQTKKTTDIENFVNAEFNPFHDVPNEIFSPFLHYSSIPPPPVNFQEGSSSHSHQSSDQLFDSDQDPFNLPSPVKMAQKVPENHPMYDTQSDDCSDENSTVSSQNRDDFLMPGSYLATTSNDNNLTTNNASNFDEDFLKAMPTKPIKKLNELILTQSMDNGKMFQSQEYQQEISSPVETGRTAIGVADWNDLSASEMSENGIEVAASSAGLGGGQFEVRNLRERF